MDNSRRKLIVRYRNDYYDITEFERKHPGGINTLKGLDNSDMTSRFMKAPPHSDAAMYLLKEYKIEKDKLNGARTNGYSNGLKSGINEENNNDKIVSNGNVVGDFDDSMEHLVDWSKAMLPQIGNVVDHYDEWVHKPVDRPLRLFEPWYLEMMTKTPWWVIPTFWIPVIIYSIYSEIFILQKRSMQISTIVTQFTLGVLLWTFLEYFLHRWVFHVKTKETKSRAVCTFHFLIHGLHHKVPFDPYRLVFPPTPGVIIATTIYYPLSFICTYPRLVLGGALFGYLCYDLMHYYLHYGNPSLWQFYEMKRYHYQHHFAHQDQGFGISSPLWDFVFGTRIHLRKLKYKLKWN